MAGGEGARGDGDEDGASIVAHMFQGSQEEMAFLMEY